MRATFAEQKSVLKIFSKLRTQFLSVYGIVRSTGKCNLEQRGSCAEAGKNCLVVGVEMSAYKSEPSPAHKNVSQFLRRFVKHTKGSIAMTFGIAASVLLAAGGMAIDFGLITVQKNKMQNAVDAATLAAGEELQVSSTSKAQIL
ncbi:MAG: pilus assembly protein, partial [Alphaproteobacteria bacterium]|nr:pilus assembly protein [Alphaproteobacteria bacterium]